MLTESKTKTLLIIANEAWNLYKFRKDFIDECLSRNIKVYCLAKFDGYESKISEHQNFVIKDIPLESRGMSPISEIWLVANIFAQIIKINPSSTLLFTIKPCIYGGLICKVLGKRYISTITGLGSNFLQGGVRRGLVEKLFSLTFSTKNIIVVQNEYDRNEIKKLNKNSKSRITLIPGSGINIHSFSYHAYPKNKNFTFLMVSRIIKDKGVLEYIEAARMFKKNISKSVCFKIVGGFPVSGKNEITINDIKQWENEGLIKYLGHKNDVRDDLKKCDCFVLPSYREGTSRALLEASLIGRPSITTDVPGCNNIIFDNQSGFLCKPRSAKSLFIKMQKIFEEDIDGRIAMGKTANKFVSKHFSNSVVIEKYLSLTSL